MVFCRRCFCVWYTIFFYDASHACLHKVVYFCLFCNVFVSSCVCTAYVSVFLTIAFHSCILRFSGMDLLRGVFFLWCSRFDSLFVAYAVLLAFVFGAYLFFRVSFLYFPFYFGRRGLGICLVFLFLCFVISFTLPHCMLSLLVLLFLRSVLAW